jgi:hypothetical protein
MTYQKIWKPFGVYLYSFVINVSISLLISFLIYKNDLKLFKIYF